MRLVLKTRRSEFMTNPTPEAESTAATIIGRTMFRTCLIGLKRDCEEWSIGGWNTDPTQIKLPNPISSPLTAKIYDRGAGQKLKSPLPLSFPVKGKEVGIRAQNRKGVFLQWQPTD